MTIHLSENRSCPDPVTDAVCLASTDYMNINFGIYNMHGRIFVVVVVVCFCCWFRFEPQKENWLNVLLLYPLVI